AGMLAKTPPAQQIHYVTALSVAKNGWTKASREKYFKWFTTAFGYKGGNSYVGFIDRARKMALKNVPQEELAYFDKLSGNALLDVSNQNKLASNVVRPKGPGRNWSVDSALAVIQSDPGGRNFEQGKAMFAATLCSTCHRLGGEGGEIGPDLTQLGTRFSAKDILVSIIEPNKEISDQFAATYFYMKDGSSVVGRVKNQDNTKYFVSQNPFAPQQIREIPKKDVARASISDAPSIMFPRLINSLNQDELRNLMAYLVSGGNQNHEVFKKVASSKP
ncbi:MAG: c-type cytochrome, partial [Chitinophagaceae bacterium]